MYALCSLIREDKASDLRKNEVDCMVGLVGACHASVANSGTWPCLLSASIEWLKAPAEGRGEG